MRGRIVLLLIVALYFAGCYGMELSGVSGSDSFADGVDGIPDMAQDGFPEMPVDVTPDGQDDMMPDLLGEVIDDLRIDAASEIVMVDASATCDPGDGWYSAYISGYMARGTALHMMAVYEGPILDVYLGPTCFPVVLVLVAYNSTTWNIHTTAGVTIARILVYSYDSQSITGADGVPVEECGYFGEDPFRWDSAAARAIASDAESRTGLLLTSFQGCYTAEEFFLMHVCD
jgi:hypothetical protein